MGLQVQTVDITTIKQQLKTSISAGLAKLELPASVRSAIQPWLDKAKFWQIALILGEYMNGEGTKIKPALVSLIALIRENMGMLARESQEATVVEFGTSGWRGRIGEEFTIRNVHIVSKAIIEMMKDPEFLKENQYSSFADVQRQGVVVFRDNRYLGDEFMIAAMQELAAAGVKIHNAGECPTGVGSAVVTMLKAAGSFNFTPSHNPMDAAGLKFNPGDGGPAGKNLTSIIQTIANTLMTDGYAIRQDAYSPLTEAIDPIAVYARFLKASKVIDVEQLKTDLIAHRDISIVVDNMHGSSRQVIEKLFGAEVMAHLAIEFLNTNDDYSFHGVKPEPSAKNQKPLIDRLKTKDTTLKLAVMLDPDADRIRFADDQLDIDMNMFGALALQYAIDCGLKQGLATTVASSGFASAIARAHNLPIAEVAVGFKNFREALVSEKAAVAFEESDGISFIGHTLEKDGIIGFLVALAMMLKNQSNLSLQFENLQKKYGYFYMAKDGEELPGIGVTEWQEYRGKVVATLQRMFNRGDVLSVNTTARTILAVLTVDGVKVVFDDHSWFLLRPSGTEAKFRYYYETVGRDGQEKLAGYKTTVSALLARARAVA